MDYLFLCLGLALILFGANILTDGASALAKRFRVSEFIIGLTIVAIGTSMPELVVSVLSVVGDSTDMAIGNVVGSNLFNGLFILGVTALVAPVPLTRNNVLRDIPLGFMASVVLLVMVCDVFLAGAATDRISRADGAVLLLLFAGFMWYSISSSRREESAGAEESATVRPKPLAMTVAMIAGGLAGLVFGGEMFLDAAISVAQSLGVSEKVIAITLVAGGTSLPELAASVVSAVKGRPGMALGNVLGSNVSNILLILGVGSVISPLALGSITVWDILMTVVASAMLFATAFTFRRKAVDRWEGAIFVAVYAAYLIWLITGR